MKVLRWLAVSFLAVWVGLGCGVQPAANAPSTVPGPDEVYAVTLRDSRTHQWTVQIKARRPEEAKGQALRQAGHGPHSSHRPIRVVSCKLVAR